MRIILAGGGQPERTGKVDRFAAALVGGGRVLSLPQAIVPREWTARGARRWLMRSPSWRELDVTVWQRMSERRRRALHRFDAIHVMGGDPYVLGGRLRRTHLVRPLRRYVASDGLVFGFSAGAIVLGHDLGTASIDAGARRRIRRRRTSRALDCLWGHNVHPHYDRRQRRALREHVRATGRAVIAIPSPSGLYVTDRFVMALGENPVTIIAGNGERLLPVARAIPRAECLPTP